jgi:hypothetical protein
MPTGRQPPFGIFGQLLPHPVTLRLQLFIIAHRGICGVPFQLNFIERENPEAPHSQAPYKYSPQ